MGFPNKPKAMIETTRLIMRPFQADDAAGMFWLNSDPDVIQYTGDPPFRSVEEARDFIATYDHYKKGFGRYMIILKATNEYAGWCGLHYNEDSGESDLGFRLLKKFRNQGYATESARAWIEYGFQSGLKKIIGRAVKENEASIRILKKRGMLLEKEFFAHGFICEQYYILSHDKL
jgi:ribosomal-protein-alanine N-acetyltransferase